MLSIKTIVHATDFSETSKHAFRLACSLAHDHGARLIVVHVIAEARALAGVMTPPLSEEYEEARRELDNIQCSSTTLAVERRLLTGDPAGEICGLADEVGAGLIVMGTQGRKGLSRLLMGSVAEQVMRAAPCPVVTVRVPIHLVRRPKRAVAGAGQRRH